MREPIREALLEVPDQSLIAGLGLPNDSVITGILPSNSVGKTILRIRHKDLKPVSEGCKYPVVGLLTRAKTHGDGELGIPEFVGWEQ